MECLDVKVVAETEVLVCSIEFIINNIDKYNTEEDIYKCEDAIRSNEKQTFLPVALNGEFICLCSVDLVTIIKAPVNDIQCVVMDENDKEIARSKSGDVIGVPVDENGFAVFEMNDECIGNWRLLKQDLLDFLERNKKYVEKTPNNYNINEIRDIVKDLNDKLY